MEFVLVGLFVISILLWLKLNLSGTTRVGTLSLWILVIVLTALQLHRVDAFENSRFNIIKTHDYYHYFISAKYFDELGYNRIYICTATAFEVIKKSQPQVSPPAINLIRDLENTQHVLPTSKIDQDRSCKQYFTEQRWQQFVADVTVYLREDNSHHTWQGILTDMGNNPPPSWYVVSQPFANILPFNNLTLHLICSIDFLILFLLVPIAIYLCFGQLASAIYLIVLAGNALSHPSWIIGSFGRSFWLVSLAFGYCFFTRGNLTLSGLCFALSCLFRLFPVVFIAALILFLFLDREKRRQSLILASSVAGWGALLLITSYFTYGSPAWFHFIELIGSRINMSAPPGISFSKAFLLPFLGSFDLIRTPEQLIAWLDKINSLYQSNILFFRFFSVILGAALVYGLNRIRQPLMASVIVGFFLIFFLLRPLTYYYMYLALILPLYSFSENYRQEIWPFIALMFALAIWSFPVLRDLHIFYTEYEITAQISMIITLFFFYYIWILGKERKIKHEKPVDS